MEPTTEAPKQHPSSLKEARGERSQDWVATEIGVTRSAVGHWETGFSSPSGPARRQLSLLLEVPLEVVDGWFVGSAEKASAA